MTLEEYLQSKCENEWKFDDKTKCEISEDGKKIELFCIKDFKLPAYLARSEEAEKVNSFSIKNSYLSLFPRNILSFKNLEFLELDDAFTHNKELNRVDFSWELYKLSKLKRLIFKNNTISALKSPQDMRPHKFDNIEFIDFSQNNTIYLIRNQDDKKISMSDLKLIFDKSIAENFNEYFEFIKE